MKFLRFANVNARSLKNKTAEIVDHVLSNNINVCIVTETWLKEADTIGIAALSPPGYLFKNFPRQSNRAGGGTGIMFNANFNVTLNDGGEKRSSEYSKWNLTIPNRTINILAVYRPPYSQTHPVSSSVSFEEFSNLLESIVMCAEVLLISGDFNFHLHDPLDNDAKTLTDLLETFGLLQHVSPPTHLSGHTLDLLISRSSSDINAHLIQSTFFVSDHCFVECNLSFPCPNSVTKEFQYRKMKHLNLQAFKADITRSSLCDDLCSDLDDLTKSYDYTLSHILEKHAPMQKKVVVVRPRIPWFNEELKRIKAKRRKLEKAMLRSKCQSDREAYHCARNRYTASLYTAKRKFYSELIDQCSGDSRKLFKVVSSICNTSQEDSFPPNDNSNKLAENFANYFCWKIELIKDNIENIAVVPPTAEYRLPDVKLETLQPLSEEELYNIIVKSLNATCCLDPIPTWLLKLCARELTPVIMKMINLSLSGGYVRDSWKLKLLSLHQF